MNLNEAQDIAFRMANLNSLNITLKEIKGALVSLANFYEDCQFLAKDKKYEKERISQKIRALLLPVSEGKHKVL